MFTLVQSYKTLSKMSPTSSSMMGTIILASRSSPSLGFLWGSPMASTVNGSPERTCVPTLHFMRAPKRLDSTGHLKIGRIWILEWPRSCSGCTKAFEDLAWMSEYNHCHTAWSPYEWTHSNYSVSFSRRILLPAYIPCCLSNSWTSAGLAVACARRQIAYLCMKK